MDNFLLFKEILFKMKNFSLDNSVDGYDLSRCPCLCLCHVSTGQNSKLYVTIVRRVRKHEYSIFNKIQNEFMRGYFKYLYIRFQIMRKWTLVHTAGHYGSSNRKFRIATQWPRSTYPFRKKNPRDKEKKTARFEEQEWQAMANEQTIRMYILL